MANTTIIRTEPGFDVIAADGTKRSVPMSEISMALDELGYASDGKKKTQVLQLAVGQQLTLNTVDGD